MKEQLIDRVKINVKGGIGGSGCMSFRREKYIPLGGPDGGNGGKGGSVYFEAESSMLDFLPFKYKVHFKGERGQHGQGSRKDGKQGNDLVIKVPRGTIVYDADTLAPLADIVGEGERYCAARGGRGGRGNVEFATAFKKAPRFAEKGEEGEDRWLVLELKLLADAGIIGFPNAGKSTLLSKVSNATPKVAPYPFTTISPNLGVVTWEGGQTAIIADLPGLIEGAHEGVGLGLTFLRHVERTRLLLHMIDLSDVEVERPFEQYQKLRKELELYKASLTDRPEIVVFNKIDVPQNREKVEPLREAYQKEGAHPFFISAMTRDSLQELLEELFMKLKDIPPPRLDIVITERPVEPEPFTVEKEEDRYVVKGTAVEKLIARLNTENDQAMDYIQQKLKRMGVEEVLHASGARRGDTVVIGTQEFDFEPDDLTGTPRRRKKSVSMGSHKGGG